MVKMVRMDKMVLLERMDKMENQVKMVRMDKMVCQERMDKMARMVMMVLHLSSRLKINIGGYRMIMVRLGKNLDRQQKKMLRIFFNL